MKRYHESLQNSSPRFDPWRPCHFMSLLILFGPTGAGKTFIGQLIQKQFNYHFFDGDSDLTPEITKALHNMKPITTPMRNQFINHLIASIEKLSSKHPKLVVAQAFLKQKHRDQLLKKLPQAQFAYINTPPSIRYQRRQKRALYPWDQTYVKKMDKLFDPPPNNSPAINNSSSNQKQLLNQLKTKLSL